MARIFERVVGNEVAERIQPEPGSDHEAELDALADDPATNWRHADPTDPRPPVFTGGRPAKSAPRAAWVAWVVEEGLATEAEADKLTVKQLIALTGEGTEED